MSLKKFNNVNAVKDSNKWTPKIKNKNLIIIWKIYYKIHLWNYHLILILIALLFLKKCNSFLNKKHLLIKINQNKSAKFKFMKVFKNGP
jgi:hypothetical protein